MRFQSIVFRRYCPDDLAEIMRIQKANQPSNLSQDEQADGFLSAEFSPSFPLLISTHDDFLQLFRSCGLLIPT